jgi:(1->4)-alpha-D-glucan 1-alpha-D-glucosylmutase
MTRPQLTATYRLQMNAGFTFEMARARVDYFARLGVSHLYLSPILAARRGSMHGYDVVDPTRINPELGTEDELRALAAQLHARDMGIILDIVPNHMGIGPENPYWEDVLAHGERSRFATWFDIDWKHDDAPAKIVLPILGDELDRVIERGELAIHVGDTHTPRITYASTSVPIDPASLPEELQLAQFDPGAARELAESYSRPGGRDRLRALLEVQHYRLVYWRSGSREINYRRFFDVNDLASVRVEDPVVFDETHALVLSLVRDGVIDGLRIDHIDGLLDPASYLVRLRAATDPDVPIVVEKILAIGEEISETWPVQGTTGYEFLNSVDDLSVDPKGFAEIETFYRRMRRMGATTFQDIARAGKHAVLVGSLRADIDRIAALLLAIAREEKKPWTLAELSTGLVEFISALPIYRTDVAPRTPIEPTDRVVIEQTSLDAPPADTPGTINAFIADVLLRSGGARESSPKLAFTQRLQQLSGPATAKGVEDTALYTYVPLASRNEVGGAPDRPLDDAVHRFHEENARRAQRWPLGLVTTNTHDAKRSADVRARLAALSECPRDWERAVHRWRRLNDKHRRTLRGRMAPDTNTEYLAYQTLVALWPAPRAGRRTDDLPDRAWRDSARTRLTEYMRKAAREAKTRTSWVEPDAAYEDALAGFIGAMLEPRDDAPFLSDVARLVSHIAPIGAWNAYARLVLHLTSPGTPDIFQGDELWNYALVDPDNRRQVDYDARQSALAELSTIGDRLRGNAPLDAFDGRLKMYVLQRLLDFRRSHADVFTRGTYRPLVVHGSRAKHVVAFARSFEGRTCVTVAGRLLANSLTTQPREFWGDTVVHIPAELDSSSSWRSPITLDEVAGGTGTFRVAELFVKLPGAVVAN